MRVFYFKYLGGRIMSNEMYSNFIVTLAKKDLEEGVYKEIHTRFPPEPNGYLHIGNAYAINISYLLANTLNGKFNLRFDDTNPTKESTEYVEAIIEDMNWLGFDYEDRLFYGSDYSEQIYEYALHLIKKGKAYVCDLSADEIREYRGTLTEKGINSPYRERTIKENLDLFINMKEGKYKEGEKVLRAKIDMLSPNISLRDPVLYRISYAPHYRTGTKWCIYPMYDFAHPLQDYIEGITHSLCSIEFKNNRPLYEWVLNECDLSGHLPKQVEFGRMNLSGVVTSKRHLIKLAESDQMDGWDDPRLPTLKGLRRRGYTKEAVLKFLNEIGVSKSKSLVDVEMLEHEVRQDLMEKAPAVMAVLDPLKVTITNLPEDHLEFLDASNHPKKEEMGIRKIPFTKYLYIEREDFSENPPKKFKRLSIGEEVRFMHAYFIKCEEVIKDENGQVVELRCTYDKDTKSGSGFTGRKVKGTIHWVSATHSKPCEVRLYDHLYEEIPSSDHILEAINPNSLTVKSNAYVESAVDEIGYDDRYQFIRTGFFVKDQHCNPNHLVFNRTVSLKSSYNQKTNKNRKI